MRPRESQTERRGVTSSKEGGGERRMQADKRYKKQVGSVTETNQEVKP